MQVNKASFEARVHALYSDLVHKEMDGFRSISVKGLVKTPVYAVTVRVAALFCHAYWVSCEVVLFFPKMIGIGIGLAVANPAGCKLPFYQRAAQIYTLYFKTVAATFTLGSLACVIPEITHYALELHKPLFSLQVKAFVETLPHLPHVSKVVLAHYAGMDSLATLYGRLKLSSDMFKNDLLHSIKAAYEKDPRAASNLVTTDSKEFQELFKQTFVRLSAAKLNQLAEQQKLTWQKIQGLNPDIWRALMGRLDPQARVQLIELLAQNLQNPEGNKEFIALYSLYTGYSYRDPKCVAVLRLLLIKMEEARDLLIKGHKCRMSDVANYSAYNQMMLFAILRLLDSATVVDAKKITFGDVTFTENFQFFGKKAVLVTLKEKILGLSQEQRQELDNRCSTDADIEISQPARACYNLLGDLKIEIDKKTQNRQLNPASSVNFMQAFDIEEDDVALLRQLLTKMKEAREVVTDKNRRTVMLSGILGLLDNAALLEGEKITLGDVLFTDDDHFYGKKAALVAIKQKLLGLQASERKELDDRCSKDQYFEISAPAAECYQLLGEFKNNIGKIIADNDSVDFSEVLITEDEQRVEAVK